MVDAQSAGGWTRGDLETVKRLCEAAIRRVEGVAIGETTCSSDFFVDFFDTATELLRLLKLYGSPLNDKMVYFRDHIATWSEDYPGQRQDSHHRPFSDLGLPVYEDDGIPYGLAMDAVPQWLAHMREFHQELTELKPTRRQTKPSSGRPKEKSTERLYADIEKFLRKQREHLEKNGASAEVIRDKQKQLTWKDIIRGINEDCGKAKYKLDEATRRTVQRSQAWKSLHGSDASSLIAEEATEDSPIFHPDRIAFDHSRALEESLRPSKREDRRTKVPAR